MCLVLEVLFSFSNFWFKIHLIHFSLCENTMNLTVIYERKIGIVVIARRGSLFLGRVLFHCFISVSLPIPIQNCFYKSIIRASELDLTNLFFQIALLSD